MSIHYFFHIFPRQLTLKILIVNSMENASQSSSKRTSNRLDFTLDQEEELIDFVKLNPALYNPKNAHYKNKMYKDRQWLELGTKINKTGMCFSSISHSTF